MRDLDAALGDGDLGITVRAGSEAVVKALSALPEEAQINEILLAAGRAFSTANPSTFAALVGGGLLAAAKTMQGKSEVSRDDALTIGQAVASRITKRGKSKLGDKTVLDALLPSLDTLQSSQGDALASLDAMIATAQARVDETVSMQSQKGRAAWVQERSIGHADPGATAYVCFLQAMRHAMDA
ncbi:Phosphoenolpyruvate-dihydroxyacetone phosphotransferase, ADP-binding subunit DhaL [Candidatus Burkholderia verschuerenii]|uniref:Phosphoenolpyruvate-dihydroxyacetone phosphotransferase, ADP-binding subunit DhaL n=1 Tax=Candidatus Burkholderia verschuerenii TaxID=242163 RepID=A0A0L0MFY1_9BURK|nr:DAK2 domain-containing protein [Candidatus Burkholderia verschuerenii]KND61190.1 Phosphoenolpyruvate-dihydroxyacetone phosphotransferase, ADP-binding subunit DhaL [Candidatus Burkholderia verschuerenii]